MKTTILLLLASFALALGAAIPSEIANNPTFYSETPDSPHEFLPGAHSPSDPVTFPPKNRGLLKRKCTGDFPYQTCWASASRRLAPPRLLTLPTLIISTITNVPGTLAAAIPSVDSLVPDASKTGLQKNEEAKGLEERGCGRWDFPYIDCSKSAGSSLEPPRMLSLLTLLFTSVANIPRALAAAIRLPKYRSKIHCKRFTRRK
jgi:hypothetical protein